MSSSKVTNIHVHSAFHPQEQSAHHFRAEAVKEFHLALQIRHDAEIYLILRHIQMSNISKVGRLEREHIEIRI